MSQVDAITPAGEVLKPEDWPAARALRGEFVRNLGLNFRRRDTARSVRVEINTAPLPAEPGRAGHVIVTSHDVSERELAEAAIRESQDQLRQLNAELEQRVARRTGELDAKTRELESFCYSVSHDLKAPLRGIDGYSRLLADEYGDKLDADARMFIGNVRKATTQMNNLIEDLLDYSRQERRTLAPTRIALREFVQTKLARRAGDLAGIELIVEVADIAVLADREGLEMALRNLLDNAIKFSARSSPPTIAIRAERRGDRCVISVQDNGTGFDMRYYDKIFEIFQRLHRAEDYPGTGIGLALVRKAMERMGGRVWAESEPGRGAVFHLEIACADVAEAA
jgi:signal transduction histidine kinase